MADPEHDSTPRVLHLSDIARHFISRSEARRLMADLGGSGEVVLDFQGVEGVEGVGQGFVDEVFRVWARTHPEIRLRPVHMNEPVEFMVRRGLPRTAPPGPPPGSAS